MKLSAFIEGLQILASHFPDRDGYHIGAEHDQFYVYATTEAVDSAQVARLKELGWFQPDVATGEDEDEDDTSPYDPYEGWSCYV